jgi:hypothetical protein
VPALSSSAHHQHDVSSSPTLRDRVRTPSGSSPRCATRR